MAEFTPLPILGRGSVLTADDWNAACNDATMLYQVPSCMYSNGEPTEVPTGEQTIVTLTGKGFGNYGFTISDNFVIVPENAMYHISFRIGWSLAFEGGGTANTGAGVAQLYHNGFSIIYGSTASFAWTDPRWIPQLPLSTGDGLLPLSAGDELYLVGIQNSGGTLSTLPTSAATAIEVTRFGSL